MLIILYTNETGYKQIGYKQSLYQRLTEALYSRYLYSRHLGELYYKRTNLFPIGMLVLK